MSKSVRAILLLVVLVFSFTYASADVPDVSSLSLEELIQLQGTINEKIAGQATYTLLPGIYDCKRDFKWNWYNCKVLPGEGDEERTVKITFHEYEPTMEPFLTYELSSKDEGIKISLLQTDSTAGLFMVVQGAPLEAVPYSGF